MRAFERGCTINAGGFNGRVKPWPAVAVISAACVRPHFRCRNNAKHAAVYYTKRLFNQP